MYCARIPIEVIVNEKPNAIKPTIVPNPAKGTPPTIQDIADIKTPSKEKKLKKMPKFANQESGTALYAKILLEACEIALVKEIPSHFDSPANRTGRSMSITAVLNPTQAPSPRKNL